MGGGRRKRGREGSRDTERAELLLELWQETSPSLQHSSVYLLKCIWQYFSKPVTLAWSPPSVPESFQLNSPNAPSGSTKGTKWQLFAPNRHRTQGWRLCCTCSSSCWPGLVGVWVIQNPAFRRASERPADTGRTEICLHVTEGAADQNTHAITRLFRGL